MVVDPPTCVVAEGPPPVRPPRVRSLDVRVQRAHHVHVPALRRVEDAAEPLPLLRQEPGVLLVGAPVLQVGLAVGDVPVAADDDLAPLGGGALAQFLQVGQELAHEADLLVLALGADLAGGEVEGGDRHTGQVGLDVAATGVELRRAETDADGVGLTARVEGDTGAALGGGGGVRHVPALGRAGVVRQLVGFGPHLLEAQHVGGGAGEPLHEALLRGGAQAIDVDGGHGEHPGTIPAHWTVSRSGLRIDIR